MGDWAAAQDNLCSDKISDCRSYGPDVCLNYADWAKVNCASTCAFCTGPTPAKDCKDYVSNCASFASDLCTSQKYRVWAEDHCPMFCGFCAVTTSTVPKITTATPASTTPKPTISTPSVNAPCEDKINFCLVYSKRACSDVTWADTYCRKWCARC
ncbi:collagen alpha-4(vi) chain [Plakobranchus ocellatus]|uniref:Collagen alpha-4(Vi) chain n=1 Tax=Plakobranchus ocellatus TaxID=259542 RepID=A0AAV3XY37_9GAST|nr:collagen alpha-4(vi) chain [Plakobranchus ocellatus]